MKRVALIATLLAASIAAGGITAYLVSKTVVKRATFSHFTTSGVGSHFTAYEQDNYPDLTYAAENAVKAVVNVEVTRIVQEGPQSNNPFYEFFGVPQQSAPRERERQGSGSGVIISSDGYVVTNNHVVENATKVRVTLENNISYDAKVIGTDPATDLALIKVDAANLPTLPFGDSDKLRLGEWVLAIGSPYELNSTITAGIVSAKARGLGVIPNQFSIESFIQTDAAVNPGNSGGALVNTRGELVGINTVIKSPTGSFAGYSFAIPSALVLKVVTDLKEYGVVQRAVLGVSVREVNTDFLTTDEAKKYNIKEVGGVYVAELDPEGAAKAAGIRPGDVITEIDGVRIDNASKLLEAVARRRPNDRIPVTVKREGQLKQFAVTLRNRSGNTGIVEKEVNVLAEVLKGQFRDVPAQAKRELRIEGGVQVTAVEQGGLLAQARIRPGYVITRINDRPIRSLSDLNRVAGNVESIEGVYPDGRSIIYMFSK